MKSNPRKEKKIEKRVYQEQCSGWCRKCTPSSLAPSHTAYPCCIFNAQILPLNHKSIQLTKDGHANEGLTYGNPFLHQKIRVSDLHLQIGEKLAPVNKEGAMQKLAERRWLVMMLVALHRCDANHASGSNEKASFTTTLLKGARDSQFGFAMLVTERLEQWRDQVRWLAISVATTARGELRFLEVGDDDDVSRVIDGDSSSEDDQSVEKESNLCFMAGLIHSESSDNDFESEPIKVKCDLLLDAFQELHVELKNELETALQFANNVKTEIQIVEKECENYSAHIEKIEDLTNMLSKFTLGRDNLEVVLRSQGRIINRQGIGYKAKSNRINFKKFIDLSKLVTNVCFYCNTIGHTMRNCYYRKIGVLRGKYKWIPKEQPPVTNKKGPKFIWDVYLLQALRAKIQTDWTSVICNHMTKVTRQQEYNLPYVVFISKVLMYHGVNVSNEVIISCIKKNVFEKLFLDHIGLRRNENFRPRSDFEKFVFNQFDRQDDKLSKLQKINVFGGTSEDDSGSEKDKTDEKLIETSDSE
ncbi:hypothetical protein V8G54_018404 [Vigna mungo]|uniref:Uncharacterized protein n=1 Tax=Vigna mungo TaxID=3915 RepID=A0AAQ3RTY6_VIGMU